MLIIFFICSVSVTVMITILMLTDRQYFFSLLTVFTKSQHSFPMHLSTTTIF